MVKRNINDVKKGKVLLSEPFMQDPHFRRSAVLLTDHRKEGTVGFILNRTIDMKINDLIADFPELDSEVFFGGPVAADTVHYLHNVGDILDDSIYVSKGVYWGGDYVKLKFLIENELIKPNNIRFFVGYSGWSGGQLEEELSIKTWMMSNMNANFLFKMNPRNLWQKILDLKGENYAIISKIPDPICLN